MGGKILMLGCGLGPNTSMHGVEELVSPTYLFSCLLEYRIRVGAEPSRCAAKIADVPERIRNWRHGHSELGYVQRYDRLLNFWDAIDLRRGEVNGGEAWLMDARRVWSVAEYVMRQEPLYFVDKLKIG